MQKLLRSFLSTQRRRRRAVAMTLRLLRLLVEAEENDIRRYSDKLAGMTPGCGGVTHRQYNDIEELCSECEYALDNLTCAIDEIASAY